MSAVIKKVKSLVTLQDGGRFGFQSQGVPVSGAMDDESFMYANMLVQNARQEACLEVASGELQILFEEPCTVALAGCGIVATCNDVHISPYKRVQISGGSRLKLTPMKTGFWSYLAIAGGFDIPVILGSRSTYLPASFGGTDGRALRVGDRLDFHSTSSIKTTDNQLFINSLWGVVSSRKQGKIRLIKGPDFERLTEQAKLDLVGSNFTISSDSNRIGYRLKGKPLLVHDSTELISTPVTKGTVQLTNDGTPIVLMADAQTIGGYPRIAQVVAVDIPRLAQKRAGEAVQFEFISYEEACQLFLARESDWNKVETAIRLKLKEHAH